MEKSHRAIPARAVPPRDKPKQGPGRIRNEAGSSLTSTRLLANEPLGSYHPLFFFFLLQDKPGSTQRGPAPFLGSPQNLPGGVFAQKGEVKNIN